MRILKVGTALVTIFAICHPAFSGEWQADRLRGVVLAMVDNNWTPISIGDVIDDSRIIRTGANGHVTFRSGEQMLEMRPNSQIQISALEGRDYTWVLHAGGEIVADVEARNVEHFGVQTHHMVAVVKGTRFTVVADEDGGSVAVDRGTVSVSEPERGLSVSITSGQRAAGGGGSLRVDGQGDLPTVIDAQGRPYVAPVQAQPSPQTPAQAPASISPNDSGNSQTTQRNGGGNSPSFTSGPGNAGSAPGRTGDAPGNSGNAPGRTGDSPGNSGNAPGRTGDAPGNSGNAPGSSGNAPGPSGESPGNSANAPGNSGGNGNSDGRGDADSDSHSARGNGGNGNAEGNGNGGGNNGKGRP